MKQLRRILAEEGLHRTADLQRDARAVLTALLELEDAGAVFPTSDIVEVAQAEASGTPVSYNQASRAHSYFKKDLADRLRDLKRDGREFLQEDYEEEIRLVSSFLNELARSRR